MEKAQDSEWRCGAMLLPWLPPQQCTRPTCAALGTSLSPLPQHSAEHRTLIRERVEGKADFTCLFDENQIEVSRT